MRKLFSLTNKKRWNDGLPTILLVVFLILYFALISFSIIKHPAPFFDWDEAIYAQVGREMIRAKSFFVPLWQGMPWLDKPPLPSFFYGVVEQFPFAPEISTRIATLILSIVALVIFYKLVVRLTNSTGVALLSVIFTSFIPIFFQRAQALNVDVFLLIGWLGYVLWFDNWTVATVFLLIATLSKSLLGLYPPLLFLLFYFYELLRKKLKKEEFIKKTRKIVQQIGLASLWFIIMFLVYGYSFIQYQFIDSHFKRVASSIEQHFGQRTFYLDILIDQFKWMMIPIFASGIILLRKLVTDKKSYQSVFLTLFFTLWFVFLNLTKTKIAWYLYPVIPQFAFLSVYPLVWVKDTKMRIGISLFIIVLFFSFVVPYKTILNAKFSTLEDHHKIAYDAKTNGCTKLYVLVADNSRTSYATLKSMNLTISTTTWWGDHPSIAYYADTKTIYLYSFDEAKKMLTALTPSQCLIAQTNDASILNRSLFIGKTVSNASYMLFQKE